uniref:Uncharacterized protein n=1 Tax=Arundo donax TaxID=35708 RepID=A0A0A8YC91_ARUDO
MMNCLHLVYVMDLSFLCEHLKQLLMPY